VSRPPGEDPWSTFWAQSDNAQSRGCLPNALAPISQAQERWWRQFAAALPRKARVLDLGTGDGVVLKKLHSVRPDLKLVGVDSATTLPPGPKPLQLRAAVNIEELPFASGSFDAVVSQFGYEYSETRRGAVEVARVLSPEGHIGMIIHHRNGPVLAHNLSRRDAIRWIVEEQKLVDQAIRFAATRNTLALPVPPAFLRMFQNARALPPSQSVAAEIAQAVLQILHGGQSAPASEVIGRLRTIEAMASGELSRISALEEAARDQREIGKLASELSEAGLSILAPGLLSEGHGARPFAWLISGRS
jgi:ubiquinone/menaquinone biosynthesis C-methylase UbiE